MHWHYVLMFIKARFHDGEILREKFFLTLSAFAVSRIDFYSLAKRNFFSQNLICPYCACINSFHIIHFFAFHREKAVVESSLKIVEFDEIAQADELSFCVRLL